MEKNHLFLNNKKYLSYSNYKNIITHKKKIHNKCNIFLSTHFPISNIIVQNNIVKKIRFNDFNNVPLSIKKHNSNKLINNDKTLKIYKLKKINLLKNNNINTENKLINKFFKYKICNNKSLENEQIYKLLKDNINKNFINKINNNFKENKNICNKTNIRFSMDCSSHESLGLFPLDKNKNEIKEVVVKIKKSPSQCISNRKINKDSFGKGIYKIIKEKKGKTKFKFKIIGTLKTEPNYN